MALVAGCSSEADSTTPLPTVAATASVRSVCLTIEQSFQDVDGDPPVLPIAETVTAILERLGLDVPATQAGCDADLDIAVALRPLGEQYSQVPMAAGRTCYAGAELAGEATLVVAAEARLAWPLENRNEPPHAVSECPSPAAAPFDTVWPEPILGALGEWWGLPALVAAMEVGDAFVAGTAAGVIAGMGPEAAPVVPFLMGQLRSGDDRVFVTAARVIVRISPEAAEQAMPLLVAALEEGERDTRLAVIRGLGRTAVPVPAAAIDALVPALSGDEDPYLRAEAAGMLGGMGAAAAAAVPALLAAVADRGPVMGSSVTTVGEAAAAALGAIGDPAAVSTLIADLESGGPAAGAAIDALRAMGAAAAEAVPALIEMLDGEHWASTSLALRAITGQADYGDAEVYRRWWRSLECATAAAGIGAAVAVADGEVRVVIDEAGFIPDSFEDARPCGPLSPLGCQTAPPSTVVAEGRFFAVHYTLANQTDDTVDMPAGCTAAAPRRQCPGRGWWITDGRISWPATWSDVWKAWAVSQGGGTASTLDPGGTAASWAVFDVPEGFEPVAIAWPLDDGGQVCLTWP
ncbi:MAG: HEAT repeat domain-containing protein [Actinomycetota bacterium]